MSSVSRATFDALKADLDARFHDAVSSFAADRDLTYDAESFRSQCGWSSDASLEILMFGLDTFPSDDDDGDGEAAVLLVSPAMSARRFVPSRTHFAMAACLLLALCIGFWVDGNLDKADASSRHVIGGAPATTIRQGAPLPAAG